MLQCAGTVASLQGHLSHCPHQASFDSQFHSDILACTGQRVTAEAPSGARLYQSSSARTQCRARLRFHASVSAYMPAAVALCIELSRLPHLMLYCSPYLTKRATKDPAAAIHKQLNRLGLQLTLSGLERCESRVLDMACVLMRGGTPDTKACRPCLPQKSLT